MLSEVWRSTLLVFLAASPVALSLPLVAEAQGVNKTYRIGHVSLMTPDGMAPYVHEFEKGLRDLGYVKGQNYVIEDRSANGNPDLVEPAAAELVRLNVDVIVTGPTREWRPREKPQQRYLSCWFTGSIPWVPG